jgi:ribosomal protein S18 acetylase RimI-like enzyme
MPVSRGAKARAVHGNDLALGRFQARAPGGEFRTLRGATIALTPTRAPQLNNVMEARFPRREAAARVAQVAAAMRAKRPTWGWVVHPADKRAGLEPLLRREGLSPALVLRAMALDIQGHVPAARPESLEVRRVSRPSEVGPYLDTVGRAFRDPPSTVAAWKRMERALGVSPRSPRQMFLGTVGGRPVASAMLLVAGRSAGLYNIGVLKRYRGRGFGRAMTEAAVAEGRRRGCALATLYATADGARLYRSMGFQDVGRVDIWVYPAPARRPRVTGSSRASQTGGLPASVRTRPRTAAAGAPNRS